VKIRHLSSAVVAIVMLTACTATTSPPEFDRAASALEYVELLRGANDLAHGSLDVPSPSTLPAFAAVASALRHTGRPVPEVSRDALNELSRRSGEDVAWSAFYLCEATGGDPTSVKDTLRAAEVRPVDSVNDAADRIITETARHCLGLPTRLRDDDWRDLARWSSGNALVGVQLAALARRLEHPTPTALLSAADITSIASAVEADGCSDWVHANSVAARALAEVPSVVEDCASNDALVLSDPTVLLYLVAANLDPAQLSRLLDANEGVVERALAAEGSVATPGTTPTGNGTIASSRDAVLYLRLSGVSRVPSWLSHGVLTAIESGLDPGDLIDGLYLCAALELDCPDAFLSRARDATRDAIDAAVNESADDGARAVETAREAALDVPQTCTRDRAESWLAEDPQLLAALAAGEKECVELVELDDATLTSLLTHALDDLRLEDALAYCLLRLLSANARPDGQQATGSQPSNSTFTTTARDGFSALWSRLDAENGGDFLSSARPLRIELAQAKEYQWLD